MSAIGGKADIRLLILAAPDNSPIQRPRPGHKMSDLRARILTDERLEVPKCPFCAALDGMRGCRDSTALVESLLTHVIEGDLNGP
jgi:hypothetical protein